MIVKELMTGDVSPVAMFSLNASVSNEMRRGVKVCLCPGDGREAVFLAALGIHLNLGGGEMRSFFCKLAHSTHRSAALEMPPSSTNSTSGYFQEQNKNKPM